MQAKHALQGNNGPVCVPAKPPHEPGPHGMTSVRALVLDLAKTIRAPFAYQTAALVVPL